jgi:hypothetical protein
MPGMDRACHAGQPEHIGLDHGLPIRKAGFVGLVQSQRQTGVIDQRIDRAEVFRQAGQTVPERGRRAHVQHARQQPLRSDFMLQLLEALRAPAGRDDARTGMQQADRQATTHAGGGAGDQRDPALCPRTVRRQERFILRPQAPLR